MTESLFEEDTLEARVSDLKEKANRTRRAKNREGEIQRAKANIGELAREVGSLESSTESLLFYNDVLTKVFEDDRTDEMERAIGRVQEVSEISDREILDAAEERETNSIIQDVTDTNKIVRNAKDETIEKIRSHRREWESEIESARDLNQIIGGTGEGFESVLNDMDEFLNSDIWEENNSISSLEARWDNLTNKWSKNAGKHGWDSFKEEHDLSEGTIGTLQQFAEKSSVRLNEIDIDNIQEMKGIDELESAIRMEIDTR